MICGTCPNSGGILFTSNPPKIKCAITGELHSCDHLCDAPIPVASTKTQTVKQIKTICRDRDRAAEFDALVNEALKEGWELTGRCAYPVLGAFLEREVEADHE